MFYKLGQQHALMTVGLLKTAQTPPSAPKAPTPPGPPPAPPPSTGPKNPPIMGGAGGQVKSLRGEGVFL